MKRRGILFVTSGPSGSGKTTLCRMIEERLQIHHNVSCTTRAPRVGEQDGRDYFFLTPEDFNRKIQENAFLEWAEVHGARYGTLRDFVEQKRSNGEDLILDLDTQGALNLKKNDPEAVLIFIDVPDEHLRNRLHQRATEEVEKINRRLAQADLERKVKEHYNHVVINEDLESSYLQLVRLIEMERGHKASL
ncbi:MAG: guanylate kinase [Deltaproteobacteria bacterium]|nr:guanylate kinase [Deltaproteobacteria bacterium]